MSSRQTALPTVEPQPGRPPLLHVAEVADAPGWVADRRDALRALAAEHGSIVVRGLGLRDEDQVAGALRGLASTLMSETEAFAPRRSFRGGLYSSTPWPPNQPMCMHHELSYALDVPGLLLFACLVAPSDGGATAVADSADVLRALPADLVDRFEREGWILTRTFNGGMGASMDEAFGSSDPAEVARYCRANAIDVEWLDDTGLQTRQRRSAVVRHPQTGERCWFNQVAFLNEWTLEPDIREFLVEEYGADRLPFTTLFGNGDPIGEDVVALVNSAYDAAAVREPWQAGDLMLVDNVRMAHNREPFAGEREILVGLADPVRIHQSEAVSA